MACALFGILSSVDVCRIRRLQIEMQFNHRMRNFLAGARMMIKSESGAIRGLRP
jgi:hypothetical protein